MHALGYALAALIGLSLGLLGAGGSIITIPILVYLLGFPPKTAIAMSLVVVGATSLVGAVGHGRLGRVRLRTAFLLGVVTMVGAYGGARLAVFVSGAAQLALLGVVMLGAAAAMYRDPSAAPTQAPRAVASRAPHPGLVAVAGLAVGGLTGLAGVGGGFLIVPTLVLLAGLPMKDAVGTSLAVITLNTVAAFAGYAGRVAIPWRPLALFTAVAIAGIALGTWLVRYVSPRALRRAFALFLVVLGAYIVYRNRDAVRTAAAPAHPSAGETRGAP